MFWLTRASSLRCTGEQNPEVIGDELRPLMANNVMMAHIVLQLLGQFVTGYLSPPDSLQAAPTHVQGAAAATLSGLEPAGSIPEGVRASASDAEQEAGAFHAAQVAIGTRGIPATPAAVSVQGAIPDSTPHPALNLVHILPRLPGGRLDTASTLAGSARAEEAEDSQSKALHECDSSDGVRLLRHQRDGWQPGVVSSTVSVRT